MKEQEKELLLKDLCARLPYKVMVSIDGYRDGVLKGIEEDRLVVSTEHGINYPIRLCKPYLRPLSSMTEEEKNKVHYFVESHKLGNCSRSGAISDYLNSIHIDYRGLIEKGLGIDCTGLNIYENEKSI